MGRKSCSKIAGYLLANERDTMVERGERREKIKKVIDRAKALEWVELRADPGFDHIYKQTGIELKTIRFKVKFKPGRPDVDVDFIILADGRVWKAVQRGQGTSDVGNLYDEGIDELLAVHIIDKVRGGS